MRMCDREGIAVIDEAPAVGLQGHNMVRETLVKHMEVISELITRDKNHPSVLMWSLANEPDSESPAAATYFKHLATHARALDPARPITFATFKSSEKDQVASIVDVLMINRYHAWYTNTGQIDIIEPIMERDMLAWRRAFRKPIMVSEYGADAVAGLHSDPPYSFTEDFQCSYIAQYFPVFDRLKAQRFFVGEQVWTFSDFMTNHGVTRVQGNKKGLFTRQRQPKMAAHTLRTRYLALAKATRRFPNSLSEMKPSAAWPISDDSAAEVVAQSQQPQQQQRRVPVALAHTEETITAAEAAAALLAGAAIADGDTLLPDESGMGPTHVWQS
mmetsp:Transcript_11892/g.27523  ORF Transcript_11892/g.27523 Transcript_11892/m.27523 type:complete len:329 (-) Transcript_11892:286-1272(-)